MFFLCLNFLLFGLILLSLRFKRMDEMEYQFTKIAIKIGSNVLTRRDGTLDVTRMSALVDQVAELYKAGIEVIMISSGLLHPVEAKYVRQSDWTMWISVSSFRQ